MRMLGWRLHGHPILGCACTGERPARARAALGIIGWGRSVHIRVLSGTPPVFLGMGLDGDRRGKINNYASRFWESGFTLGDRAVSVAECI